MTDSLIKLNIGSGYKRIQGYINVDHDPLCDPDILADLENLRLGDIADSTVSNIVAHHVLEHIGNGFLPLIKELYRVSAPGAEWDIAFPHHRSELQYCDPTHVRSLTVDQFMLFSKAYNRQHIAEYNSSSGFGLKLDVDLVIERYRMIPSDANTWKLLGIHDANAALLSTVFNNVYSEVQLILKVKK